MGVTINSNVAALNAQRRLAENSRALDQTFQRLSSGLRINRASDDASGLAISQLLNVDARVFTQGIRNFNDGISVLNVAEGALTEASNIVIRIRELTTQSANGTLTFTQREALHQEANSLVNEFNRIVNSSDFNGRKLLDGSLTDLRLQGSYGANGQISLGLGTQLGREEGNGNFADPLTLFTSVDLSLNIFFGDYNGDGNLDRYLRDDTAQQTYVFFGNGDGTFSLAKSFASPLSLGSPGAIGADKDFNGDGQADIVNTVGSSSEIWLQLSNGDGTFRLATSIGGFGALSIFAVGDVNGDGNNDIFAQSSTTNNTYTFLGNGNGTFRAGITSALGASYDSFISSDFNNDGLPDLYLTDSTGMRLGIAFSQGDGTFSIPISQGLGFEVSLEVAADVDNDGHTDILGIEFETNIVHILFGNGDGSFRLGGTHAISADGTQTFLGQAVDMNGDGYIDLSASADDLSTYISLGNGDGTFRAALSSVNTIAFAAGDTNDDGINDYLIIDPATYEIRNAVQNTSRTTELPYLNLYSRAAALETMPLVDAALGRITGELGNIGAAQSRVSTAINVLQQGNESFRTAASRIVDADVADESAQLVKSRILQSSAAAVLSQANQLPSLALLLLRDS